MNLVNLEPFDQKQRAWRVVIDTPKGSHNKYKFDPELGAFVLSHALPEGMRFPYDFGFLPSTLGEDGDPLDVLVLMDAPAFCGCVVVSRLIGVIRARQKEQGGDAEENDRLVAVPVKSRVYKRCANLKDVDPDRLREIEEFFVSYNRIHGKEFHVRRVQGPRQAEKLVKDAMRASQ